MENAVIFHPHKSVPLGLNARRKIKAGLVDESPTPKQLETAMAKGVTEDITASFERCNLQ
jgi:hypothetical protein